jgi:hypothetical protein
LELPLLQVGKVMSCIKGAWMKKLQGSERDEVHHDEFVISMAYDFINSRSIIRNASGMHEIMKSHLVFSKDQKFLVFLKIFEKLHLKI